MLKGGTMNIETIKRILTIISFSFSIVVLITPFIRKIAFEVNAIDIPGGRHIHKKATPKLGGLAIFLGFLFGYMVFGTHSPTMNAILIGAFIILLTGVIDDICDLDPFTQFIGQLVAACIIVFYGNMLIKDVSIFGLYINFSWLSYPLTIFFIVGCINCINFIDGLDGLSGGICSIYYLTVGIIATMQGKLGLDFVLTFVMLGSTLGFLVYNFHPASIFAGNSGSMFMGYIISVIALLGFKNVTMTSLIIPLLILAIPILDTAFAILRRMIKRKNIFKADGLHIHHQLINRNLSQTKAVLIIYAIDILFAVATIIFVLGDRNIGVIIYAILFIIMLIFVVKTNVLFPKELKDKLKQKIKGY